jgi:hypothetical protein
MGDMEYSNMIKSPFDQLNSPSQTRRSSSWDQVRVLVQDMTLAHLPTPRHRQEALRWRSCHPNAQL